ncbi:hypothetical protein BU23DRAFT_564297 [Bimuria novae-zelandiae CBS 107.79]|uniref:Uncharacterized protein n=1 Tax=Bimuria novae-zelandiae CBS 107.79 TaxID=1447943 RepID=A0A6A5VL38_9PLEO|nr:hypothetical protein BU23DRAFT_564297 [Bimuria novae-zelandiae CBS 107.79]
MRLQQVEDMGSLPMQPAQAVVSNSASRSSPTPALASANGNGEAQTLHHKLELIGTCVATSTPKTSTKPPRRDGRASRSVKQPKTYNDKENLAAQNPNSSKYTPQHINSTPMLPSVVATPSPKKATKLFDPVLKDLTISLGVGKRGHSSLDNEATESLGPSKKAKRPEDVLDVK